MPCIMHSSKREDTRILIIGPICWNEIIYPSGERDGQIGGSVFYTTRAILHIANYLQSPVSIDVWAHVGNDRYHAAESLLNEPNIARYYALQERTLQFANQYVDEHDWTHREQMVMQPVTNPISSHEAPQAITERLQNHQYQAIFLLPLTPYDFLNLTADMIPYLKRYDSESNIAIELQGFMRDFPSDGGVVTSYVNDALPLLFKQQAVGCVHCSVEEGIELIQAFGNHDNAQQMPLEAIATQICRYGVRSVGLTNGDQGAFVAWQNAQGTCVPQHIPTVGLSQLAIQPYVTGAGDTWLGVYGYALLGLGFPPVVSASLATQFATLKCLHDGALGTSMATDKTRSTNCRT